MTPPLLDLYLLSLLDRGHDTPYSLQKEGGLSLGASTPSLRRLTEASLVKRKEYESRTNRPRHVYQMTAAGAKLAKNGWREHFQTRRVPTDLDALLRIVDMAAHYGSSPADIAAYLKMAAKQRSSLARRSASETSSESTAPNYRHMRSKCEAARLRAEAHVLNELAGQFKRDTPPKTPGMHRSLATPKRKPKK